MEKVPDEIKNEVNEIDIQFWADIAFAQFKRTLNFRPEEDLNEKVKTSTNKKSS
ncbi:MAG: hypothetical protein WCO33_04955 [bacterium]